MKDYYKILGINSNASEAEIKRAYRKLAVLYHPDKNPDPAAEQYFKEVNEAYDVLGDASKKSVYDFKRQSPFTSAILDEAKQEPQHRDPAYRRRRSQAPPPNTSYSKYELMRHYLPYFSWLIYAGLFLMLVFALDYTLPTQIQKEEIEAKYFTKINRRQAGHFVIVTNNRRIKLNSMQSGFQVGKNVFVEYTPLLNVVMMVTEAESGQSIHVGGIYSPLIFVPFALFAVSIIGFFLRNNVEYAFNISIVNGILIIIVLYLIYVT